jgi:hypothetical protein
MFDPFRVGTYFGRIDPWVLPTAIEFHACGVKYPVAIAPGTDTPSLTVGLLPRC